MTKGYLTSLKLLLRSFHRRRLHQHKLRFTELSPSTMRVGTRPWSRTS